MPSKIGNSTNLKRLYVAHCQELNIELVKRGVFRRTFEKYNLGVHVPKKHNDYCEGTKQNGIENLEADAKINYNRHKKEHKEFQKLFLKDQNN